MAKTDPPAQTDTASKPPKPKYQPRPKIKTKDLSPLERKAEAWAKHDPEQWMFQTRCSECKEPMWTWSDRENACEDCAWEIRERIQEVYQKQQKKGGPKPSNPFTKSENEVHRNVGLDSKGPREFKNNPFAQLQDTIAKRAPGSPFAEPGAGKAVKNPFAR